VSKHWKPEAKLASARAAKPKHHWPEGATAGLILVAACCIGVAAVLYKVAGPRDVFPH
jgi:hypothetical protein